MEDRDAARLLEECTGFEWDEHNSLKNWSKHPVAPEECEEVFFNLPLLLAKDRKHSRNEQRYYVLGQTNSGRLLFIAFTLRKKLIRVISARKMQRKERRLYSGA